ncbi:MAG: hypothetical protein AAGC88_03095 [Bacteroidota bacterium]
MSDKMKCGVCHFGGRDENLAGCVMALWEEALNFLDFFASFLGQAKNEEPVRLEDKVEVQDIVVEKFGARKYLKTSTYSPELAGCIGRTAYRVPRSLLNFKLSITLV